MQIEIRAAMHDVMLAVKDIQIHFAMLTSWLKVRSWSCLPKAWWKAAVRHATQAVFNNYKSSISQILTIRIFGKREGGEDARREERMRITAKFMSQSSIFSFLVTAMWTQIRTPTIMSARPENIHVTAMTVGPRPGSSGFTGGGNTGIIGGSSGGCVALVSAILF